ncbi:MAG: PTS transporter subunit EIIC [Ruminococcus flavefaciens]|nr:PTS transporter subunit EIIC [Ruminococcus flavefaciens]
MNALNRFFEKYFLPFATKLNGIKGFIAIRDAFVQVFPLTFVGSIVVCINVVLLSSTGFIGQFLVKLIPNLDNAQSVLNPVSNGTINLMAVFIVFLIARNMALQYEVDGLKAGLTALASFFILYPPKENGMLTDTYLGANGIFVAIITGLLAGYAFSKFTKIDKLHIKMPEQVPPEVSKSFMVAIPSAIVIILASVIAYIISLVEPQGLNALIYATLQAPIQLLGATPFTPLLLIFMAMILWSVGIHGTFTVSPIYLTLYASMNIANISYAAQAGTTIGSPHPYTWFVLFENYGCIGGTGNTLALIAAILILSKRKDWKRDDYTKTAKIGFIPGLFCINEPLIFGLPIVLNPILVIPFILTPIISMGLGALMIASGFVAPGTLDVGWTTPQPIKAFLSASGSWQTAFSVILVFIICVLIYIPFVMIANKETEAVK